jgi:hypothetical protein
MEDDQDRRVSGFILRAEDGSTRWLGPSDVAAEVRGMVGQQLPGGCDDCTAWHEYIEDSPDIFDVLIHHDETCPQLAGG